MPEHQCRQGPMPARHAQPTSRAAGAVANDVNVHVDWLERVRFFVHELFTSARSVKVVSNSAQNFFVSD
jgi:hypothetical protein